jgi:hypothetical protein
MRFLKLITYLSILITIVSCTKRNPFEEPALVVIHNPRGIEVMQVKFEDDLTLYDDSTGGAFTGFEWNYLHEPVKIFPSAYVNGGTIKVVVDLKTDGTYANDTWIKINSLTGSWTGGAMGFASITPESSLVSDINSNTNNFTCTGGTVQGINALDFTLKWSIYFRRNGETTWQPFRGEAGEEKIINTSHNVYVTKGSPSISTIWSKVVAWSCSWAKGYNDDKDIADVIIRNISNSGLHYGETPEGGGYLTVRELLAFKYGMCRAFMRFFYDLCAVQNVIVQRRYWSNTTLMTGSERMWLYMIITKPGLNNYTPRFDENDFGLVNYNFSIATRPRYFGSGNTNDDVDECRKVYYAFQAYPDDGHAVCFLDWSGSNVMYDPSFGTSYLNLYPTIPSNEDIYSGTENSYFANNYWIYSVQYQRGLIQYINSNNILSGPAILDISTSLIDKEYQLEVIWIEID